MGRAPAFTDTPDSPPRESLVPFFVLSYLLCWLILGPWFYVFTRVLNETVVWWVWPLLPVLFAGTWAPSVAAIILTARQHGRPAVKNLLRAAIQWRVPVQWYAFALLVPVALTAAASLVSDFGAIVRSTFSGSALLAGVPIALAQALPFGPLEEIGWRGYALPRLLRKRGVWSSSLILGVAWTFWHLPMMVLMPGAALPEFMDFGAGSVALYLCKLTAESCILTFLYCMTNGSVLIAILTHAVFNAQETIFFGAVANPSDEQLRQIYVINIGLLWVVALLTLGWLRRYRRATQVSPLA